MPAENFVAERARDIIERRRPVLALAAAGGSPSFFEQLAGATCHSAALRLQRGRPLLASSRQRGGAPPPPPAQRQQGELGLPELRAREGVPGKWRELAWLQAALAAAGMSCK